MRRISLEWSLLILIIIFGVIVFWGCMRDKSAISTRTIVFLSDDQLKDLEQAARNGDCEAAYKIGQHFFFGVRGGEGSAIPWYRKAIDCGRTAGVEEFADYLIALNADTYEELTSLKMKPGLDEDVKGRIQRKIDERYDAQGKHKEKSK